MSDSTSPATLVTRPPVTRPPVGVRRTSHSFVDLVPHEFTDMVLPRPLMQIPGPALYGEASKTKISLDQQISSAKQAIYVMNQLAEQAHIDVRLAPTDREIETKLNTDYTYWLRTADLNIDQLSGIIEWLTKKITESITTNPNGFYLIIDFQNIFGSLQDIIGKCPRKQDDPDKHSMWMSEIADILCKIVMNRYNYMRRIPIGIILCVQNHNLNDNPDFYNLIVTLNRCVRITGFSGNIIVIPTHNRSAFDDFIFLTAGDILNKNSPQKTITVAGITREPEPYEMLTNDELRDMLGINIQLTHKMGIDEFLLSYYRLNDHPYLLPVRFGIERQRQISAFKKTLDEGYPFARPRPNRYIYSTWRRAPYDILPHTGPSPPISGSARTASSRDDLSLSASSRRTRHHSGGTIKYKKSLATKRSRKVYKKTYKKTYKKKKTIKRKKRL